METASNNFIAEDQDNDENNLQFLSFSVEDVEYGVSLIDIREIRVWSDTTAIPNAPQYMRGVINLRGQIIPIFDLRARFGRGHTTSSERHVVIIIAAGERTIGVLVDAVSDILATTEENIKSPPSLAEYDLDQAFIHGLLAVEDKMVILLDVENLFSAESLEHAIQVSQQPTK